MRLERKSVPIKNETARVQWTPYRIGDGKDNTVRVSPYFTAPVADFSQEKFTISEMPYGRKPVDITQITDHQYAVGEFGTLEISKDSCRFTSQDGKNVFTVSIPAAEKRDSMATAMAIFGVCMATAGK